MEISEKIANRAHDLFILYGIKSITMDEIASDMGISKKTIYHFFSNKDALVDLFLSKEIERHRSCIKTLKIRSENVIYELYFILVYTKDLFTRINPAILTELRKNYTNAFNELNNYKNNSIYTLMKDNLIDGQNIGLYCGELHIDHVVSFLLESVLILLNSKISERDVQEEEIFGLLISGLVTEKGASFVNKYKNQSLLTFLTRDRPFWDS